MPKSDMYVRILGIVAEIKKGRGLQTSQRDIIIVGVKFVRAIRVGGPQQLSDAVQVLMLVSMHEVRCCILTQIKKGLNLGQTQASTSLLNESYTTPQTIREFIRIHSANGLGFGG
jgi:hypothetical protein